MPAPLKGYFPQFLENEGVPSVRLLSGFLMVLLTVGLEIHFASKDNVLALVEANCVFVGSLFAIGGVVKSAQAFAANPATTTVNADKAKFDVAGDANFSPAQKPTEGAPVE